ncbi:MAG: PAS domain S-box protein, partial [Campylobacteraceae bacterium]|nr:PAS domain S-box protein [Campylobacteraceae bacterium]
MYKLKNFTKKIDVLFVFLAIFIVVSISLSLFIKKIYNDEQVYNFHNDSIYELINLNTKFDNFISGRKEFINLDTITKQTKKFGQILRKLKIDDKDREFLKDFNSIDRSFQKKAILIEKFKSYNALSIYSLSYIIDISKSLREDKTLQHKIIEDSISDIFKLYLNLGIETKTLDKNIEILKKEKNASSLLTVLIINLESLESRLKKINNIRAKAHKIPLTNQLTNLHIKFDVLHKRRLSEQADIFKTIFTILALLLLSLLFINKKSRKLQEELKSFKYAVQNSDDTIVITDKDRHITYVNDAFVKNTGYNVKEAMGKNPSILKSGKLPQEFYDELNAILDSGKKWSGDFINKDKNGDIYYEKASITQNFTKGRISGNQANKL